MSQYFTDSTGKSLIDYDAVGRVIRQRIQSVVWTGSPTTYTDQQFNYNLAGELTSQVLTQLSESSISIRGKTGPLASPAF